MDDLIADLARALAAAAAYPPQSGGLTAKFLGAHARPLLPGRGPTHQCAFAVSALLLAAGCATAPARPPYAAFETIGIPKGLK